MMKRPLAERAHAVVKRPLAEEAHALVKRTAVDTP